MRKDEVVELVQGRRELLSIVGGMQAVGVRAEYPGYNREILSRAINRATDSLSQNMSVQSRTNSS